MPRPKQAIPAPYLVKEKSSGLWLVYYTCPVKRYTKKRSTGTRNRGEADLALQAIASELFSIGPKNADYKIAELLAGYVASKEEDLADSDERALKRLTEFFGGFKPEQLVDTAWKRYRKWRMSHDHSHASVLQEAQKGFGCDRVSRTQRHAGGSFLGQA